MFLAHKADSIGSCSKLRLGSTGQSDLEIRVSPSHPHAVIQYSRSTLMSDEALSSATPHNKGPMQVSGDSFLPADSGIEGPSNL